MKISIFTPVHEQRSDFLKLAVGKRFIHMLIQHI